MRSRFRNNNLAGFRADEHEHVHLPQATFGYGSHRKEITRPQRFAVTFDKVGPGIRCTIRARLDAFFFQNVAHRLTAYLLDAEGVKNYANPKP